MNRTGLGWHTALLAMCLLWTACGDDDAGETDSGTDTSECELVSCFETACCSEVEQACSGACPAGTIEGGCAPPAPPPCYIGPCCEEVSSIDCGRACPEGTSRECTPDPLCEGAPSECVRASDCSLEPADCCFGCGVTEMISIAPRALPEYEANCADIECPELLCPSAPSPFRAACVENSCEALRIDDLAYTACSEDSECEVAIDGCCECESLFVAIRADVRDEFNALVCTEEMRAEPCARCEPIPPRSAACVDSRCVIAD